MTDQVFSRVLQHSIHHRHVLSMVYINIVQLKTIWKLPLRKRSKSDQPLYEIELICYSNEGMEAVKQCDVLWFDIALMRNISF